jgi:putative serine protease PepD
MNSSSRTRAAALVAVAVAGAGVGAASYGAATHGSSHSSPTDNAASAARALTQATTTSPSARNAGSTLSVGQVAALASKGLVEVDATTSGSGQPYPFGEGSGSSSAKAEGTGFVYDDAGHIVTNEHVVDGARSVTVKLAGGATFRATVVGTDASSDLAVLRVNAPAGALHPLALGDSSAVEVGEGVVAIGNPYQLDNTVTSGIVSALGREITSPNSTPISNAIQTDAAINHGNSGGPLLDLTGRVIGVTAQIESDTGGNDGIGFAIPSNTVKRVADQLISSGKVRHALLGVNVETIPASLASTLGESSGVAVAQVESGSGAAHAGLHAATGKRSIAGVSYPTGGDVITAIDGRRVTTAPELRALIDAHQPGDVVRLRVVRNGSGRTVKATLGARS